ncbi:hypothetical protein [Streptomyces rubiginosohelvolus]
MATLAFASAACFAVAALCAVALRDVPRITGTVAAIATIAAFGAAILR